MQPLPTLLTDRLALLLIVVWVAGITAALWPGCG